MKLTDEEKTAFKAGQLEVWIENPADNLEYKVKDIDETGYFIADRYNAVEDRRMDLDGQLADFPAALPLD